MPATHRKKPFSNKQKKEQLKAKREQKKVQERDEFGNVIRTQKGKHKKAQEDADSDESSENQAPERGKLMNPQPSVSKTKKGYDPNRYRLHFMKESQEDIEKRKQQARQPFQPLPESALEMDIDDIYRPGSVLDLPKRPPWDYRMSKAQVEAREEQYFKNYVDTILSSHSTEELSYFEMNLETWRQLWRVIEMADVLLLIIDIRHPALHFSPTFHQYVTQDLNKPVIAVLNKIDLVPPALVVAWQHALQQKYPGLHIVCFTSFPKDKTELEQGLDASKVQKKRKRGQFSAVGPQQLLQVCQTIVQDKVELDSWREKIESEMAGTDHSVQTEVRVEELSDVSPSDSYHERYKNGVLTLGCCGYPNVGKSSLINGLMGRKVVSVSKTPGHTKHFQTIYLTPHVKLCDSPGLVFPSLVPKPLQILAGIYPIAQVREPYSVVGYLAQRLPIHRLLKLTHPEGKHCDTENSWSAMDICDAWAEKRGFLTAKAARPDIYRAANNILRLALEGRLVMCTTPPGYTQQKEHWLNHPDTEEIMTQQKLHRKLTHRTSDDDDSSQEEDNFVLSQDEDENEAVDDDSETDSDESESGGATSTSNPFALLGGDE